MFKFNKLSVLVVLVALVLLMLPAAARAQEELCTVTVVADGAAVFEVPSTSADLVAELAAGDQLVALDRLGRWLLVQTSAGMGYMAASLADVPDTCTFASAGMNDWLQQLVIAGIVVLGSTAAGPIITYITQIAKIALRLFGLDASGGKIALVIGVVFVQVVIGANVLGVQDVLTGQFETAARILGNILALLASLVVYGPLKRAGVMPGVLPE